MYKFSSLCRVQQLRELSVQVPTWLHVTGTIQAVGVAAMSLDSTSRLQGHSWGIETSPYLMYAELLTVDTASLSFLRADHVCDSHLDSVEPAFIDTRTITRSYKLFVQACRWCSTTHKSGPHL